MFRLESYITPIILNHVARYVKNIRPRDAQVSLWEGEVAFQNLDLRLDVLEQELNLPFEFLSGHIHELVIHVPWTKINSEPINITINTIEFVLKLKDQGREKMNSPTNQSPKKVERKKKTSRIEESQPGYNTPGLVNKIINNITINCHNIILKYVEEDIVVSMNIQLLSLHSADEDWNLSFVDIHPLKRLIRKVIEISDLTICLDKRNSMGQIEVCQEPILYKCSLHIRLILDSFNDTKKTRIAIRTNLIEMNISSLQFPMAIRLLNLMLALKTGDLKVSSDIEEISDSNDEINSTTKEPSWTTTIWNMLPNFSFTEIEEEATTTENVENILDFALYVENFKFTLKSSEFINESIVGTLKKIRYNSIVSILFNGILLETVVNDKKGWFNFKTGISKVLVEPQGNFSEDILEKYLINSDNKLKGNFIFESLFDNNCQKNDPITNITEYLNKITEEYLNYRAPCFNLDITKCRKQRENICSENSIDEINYRLHLSSVIFRYNTTANKIIDTIKDLIIMYDYPPYKPINDKDVKLHPPLLEDYDSLMAEIPIKLLNFNIQNISLKIFPQEELYVKNQHRIRTVQKIAKKFKGKLPHIILNIQFCNGKWITPQDPELLVHTTCQLPKQPTELLNACYEHIFINIKEVSIDLYDSNCKYNLLQIPFAKAEIYKILYPHLWQHQTIAESKLNLSIRNLILKSTKPRLILIQKLIKTLQLFNYVILMDIIESSAQIDMHNIDLFELECIAENLKFDIYVFEQHISTRGSLKTFRCNLGTAGFNKIILIESNENDLNKLKKTQKNYINWIEWSLQFAKNNKNREYATILSLNIQSYNIFLNKTLIEFLKYVEMKIQIERDLSPEHDVKCGSEKNVDRKSTKKSLASSSRKISHPEETIHLSSDKDDKNEYINLKKNENSATSCRSMFNILKLAILNLHVDQGAIFINESSTGKFYSFEYETAIVWLPRILCKSLSSENFDFNKTFAIRDPSNIRESFPWNCEITSFSIILKTKDGISCTILHPIQTSITIAMNHKVETISDNNNLLLRTIDQAQENCKKNLYNIEDFSKKKKDIIANDIKEEEILSIKCDWSNDEFTTDFVNNKNKVEKEINDENIIHMTIPPSSPKRIDRNEIHDHDMLQTFEIPKIEKDNIAINFHIDTSPILFEIKTGQVDFLRSKLDILLKILNLLGVIGNEFNSMNENFRITDFDEDTTVKEFLEMDSCSDSSSRADYSETVMVSLWLQWTVTKIGLNIVGFSENKTKLSLEMEDLIISIDKQADYTKIKGKLGTFSIRHLKINQLEEIKIDEGLKFNMKTNNSELPFIDVTITIACQLKNAFKKIGAHKKSDLNNQLHEIIVSMQAFEMSLDLENLMEFMPVIAEFFNQVNNAEDFKNFSQKQTVLTGSEMPLIYFDLGGFTIYSPVKKSSVHCNVLILNINEIKLSSNVKNPLTRKPVRSDVYNKAAQMGLLNLHGSIIEDRQYELIFNNISVATGNWKDLLAHMKDQENNLRNTNPAFEWNHQDFTKTPLKLQEIFNSCVISITFAPMVIYQKVLICGQSIEFNCVSDLHTKITIEQIKLFSCISLILKDFIHLKCEKDIRNEQKKNNKVVLEKLFNSKERDLLSSKRIESDVSLYSYETKSKKTNLITDIIEERYTDSGISTYERVKRRCNKKMQYKLNSNEPNKNIPYEISFLAGVFTIECYCENDSISKTKHILSPLFKCTINQPSMLICQKVYEKFLKASLHNLTINLSQFSQSDQKEEKFPTNVFNTLRGKLDISGIPPSLFSLQIHFNKLQKCGITCSFLKPIKVNLQSKTIEDISKIWIVMQDSIKMWMSKKPIIKKKIVRCTKLMTIKKNLANADTIYFKLDQIIIKSEEHERYEIEIILDCFKTEINFVNRPEKLNLKWSLDTFYIKTENKICLHPVSANCNFNLTQEKWSSLPLISTNLNISVIQIDIGVENLRNIITVFNSFNKSFIQIQNNLKGIESVTKVIWKKSDHEDSKKINMDSFEKIRLPKIFPKGGRKGKEEFYQDDLRAGAFQFVETHDDSSLPLPYQIYIITKNHGIICWRYPQPRKICKLQIFPIPMPVANPKAIKCQIEYFSELYKKFLPFCDFSLSETDCIDIEIPNRIITANVWRVNILQPLVSINREYFDTSEEDEEVKLIKFEEWDIKNDNNFTLHPKVLVGCMKIDTSFNEEYISKFEILLDIAFFELNLQNQQEKIDEMASTLNRLKLSKEFSYVETFLSFNIKNNKILARFLSTDSYSIDSEMNLSFKILDYGFSNMQFLIEETNLKNYFVVEKNSILINCISDIIKVNIDQGILHTLVVSTHQWNQRIISTDKKFDLIISRFLVANLTQSNIVFGQSNTNENIYLNSKEYVMYSFISEMIEPSLTFYNGHKLSEHSDSFQLKIENSINYLSVGENVYVIETKKLSSTQLSIYVKGQIEFLMMTEESFKVQFGIQNADGTHTRSSEYILNQIGATSFCHNVLGEIPQTIRIKFNSERIRLWSGDIPLRANKNLPWLVKVPISRTHDFISYWFRIVIEEIVDLKTSLCTPLRILVMIWPIYQIQSMFPRKILFTESSTNTELEIEGGGNILDLSLPATHETEHIITFAENFVTTHGEDRQSCNLSLKTIDWNQFFYYDDKKWTIDKCLTEFQKSCEANWPYKNEEELQISRKYNSNKNPTLPIYKIYPSREFSCTLRLETAPWCIFINSISSSIQIKCIKTQNYVTILSNHLGSLFPIVSGFIIEIDSSLGWIKSLPIHLDSIRIPNLETKSNENLIVKDNDEIEILFSGNIIHKAILKSMIENGRRFLLLKPVFILSNYSNISFYYIPFCFQYNHDATREEIKKNMYKNGILAQKHTKSVFGLAVDRFYNLSGNKIFRNKDFYHFCITMFADESQEITIPIYLTNTFNRKCFSLQKNNNSIALCANCLEKDGQYYLNVFNDSLPGLEIHNWTDLNFLISQTDSNENSVDVAVKFEFGSNNFGWHQILKRTSILYYTPPDLYLNFPDNGTSVCNIVLAFFNEDSSDKQNNIRWSKPLRINVSSEKFFNIPMFGDVKIIVCDKHKITKIFISYIAEQLEFSVKDLRSRLISPSRTLYQEREVLLQAECHTSQKSARSITTELNCKKCSHNNLKCVIPFIDVNFYVKEIILDFSSVSTKKNFNKTEILAIHLDDVITKYDNRHKNVKLIISNLQIDNQQFSSCKYDFPVMLCAQEMYNISALLPSIHDLNEIINFYEEKALVKLNLEFRKNSETFELCSILCKIKPIRAYIEDTYLNDLLEYLTECSIENLVFVDEKKKEKVTIPKGHILVPDQIKNRALYLAEPIKLDFLRIEPLNVMFSVHTCIRFYIALDHTPLELAAFERRNITTLPIRLGYTVGMHYLSGALFGAGWVVGSLEILGSPSGLARCFTIGFRDFLTLPLEGFFRGPWGFIMGITHGSVSLLRNITAGTVNSVTKLASSVARNIDRLTFDEEHFQRTEIIRRTRPQGFTEGLSQGLTSLGINILGAVGGLARHPLEAQNPVQIVTGVGKGIVGAITKPISGAAELVALTGHGVLHTVGFNTQPKQRSPVNYKLYISPANSKVWKLLPNVLQFDQILFFHEATLVVGKKLKRVTICMTSTVLAILELNKNKLSYVLPVDRVIASFDKNDPTLININLKPKDQLVDELMDKHFAKRRILNFLRSSRTDDLSHMPIASLDLLIADNSETKLEWSFYICENLGHHFLQYLKIITPYRTEEL